MSATGGFDKVLEEIGESIRRGMSLHEAVTEIVSVGGRCSVQSGWQSLTPEQLALVEQVHDVAGDYAGAPAERVNWYIGIWSYGRIWLASTPPHDRECRLFGVVTLAAGRVRVAAERARQIRREWGACDNQVDAFFAGLRPDDVRTILYEVHETVDHMDPVLLYIGDVTLTNFGRFNNLQERNGADIPSCFFRRAQHVSPADWTPEERTFVFCFYWLRMAGFRGEEYCGRQLNAASLNGYFDRHLCEYGEAPACGADIEAKARKLAQIKVPASGRLLTWRRINGLNFSKEERLLALDSIPTDIGFLPADLRRRLMGGHCLQSAACSTIKELAEACINNIDVNAPADRHGMNGLEFVLKMIVESAIMATGSDAGMTRGLRDVQRLRRAMADGRYADICAWPLSAYFCGVFPSDAMLDRLAHAQDILTKIMCACAVRMQFNSWHYMPGHCPRESVPPDRHFYLPPRMPDIAVWSDQHHAGHVHASVRHSIRSPAPLELDGVRYPGMIDLRLFRQDGPEYTEDEFRNALAYTELLRAVWQAAADFSCDTSTSLRITAFDKSWYQRYYADRCALQARLTSAICPPEPAGEALSHHCPRNVLGTIPSARHSLMNMKSGLNHE